MLNPRDCVVVTHDGRETIGYVDYIKNDVVWIDLDARIDGFLHMPLPIEEVRLYARSVRPARA